MRRYQLSSVEHIHMMRHVPRIYDMSHTHIMHKGVNKHVDVVLRCSPKNWKKKKVSVCVVRGEKKNDAVDIRANAKKGYVAVRKAPRSERFEADRKTAAQAYETKYGAPSAANDALIHDMKNQLSSMAQRSAAYIDRQLQPKPAPPRVQEQTASAPLSATPPAPSASSISSASSASETHEAHENKEASQKTVPLISEETSAILQKGGYRLPKSMVRDNPYASNYAAQTSSEEFHDLMKSLEKSLDEACSKYVTEPAEAPVAQTDSSPDTSGYGRQSDFSVSVNGRQEINAETAPLQQDPPAQERFEPALTFSDGGEHYIPEDELFDRELNRSDDDFPLPEVKKRKDRLTPRCVLMTNNRRSLCLPCHRRTKCLTPLAFSMTSRLRRLSRCSSPKKRRILSPCRTSRMRKKKCRLLLFSRKKSRKVIALRLFLPTETNIMQMRARCR